MSIEQVLVRPVNRYGQPYVHLYPSEFYAYRLTAGPAPQVVRIPNRHPNAVDRVGLRRQVELMLRGMGWELGIDGWREPLNPEMPILATAHIFPRGERRRWLRNFGH